MTTLELSLSPAALDVLAAAVATRVQASLGLSMPPGVVSPYADQSVCDAYVSRLDPKTLDRMAAMFGELAAAGTLSSERLSELLNVPPRKLSSNVTNAAKKRAHTLGLPLPFVQGTQNNRTVWVDYGGNAERIVQAIRREKVRGGL